MVQNSRIAYIKRQLKYFYLRLLHLKGEPHELALGMAIGVFSGMMPILPFQIALAVALALCFKASKITAAIGTWASNPLNWYFIYLYDYKLGAYLLGLEGGHEIIKKVMAAINRHDEISVIWNTLFSSGAAIVTALLIGGIIIGTITAVPTYLVFIWLFRKIREWRQKRKEKKAARVYKKIKKGQS
ncbi:MAG: DUF2062 domain-containing protein [Deltaproteobacteria bacterium]|nr:DUF2062 domain-containing protein [Deltaproteobacteria bacterium]